MNSYNFTTNIERRMPQTGKVFCIDRMTSEWAEQHPFDLDGFLEEVFEKYEQIAQEDGHFARVTRDRESLRRMWEKVMAMPVRGDASLYPNRGGRQEPALMEVWLRAGDYWRCGLRRGDTLPAMVPMTRITRTEGGWIALFPKDLGLLDAASEELRVKSEELATAEESSSFVAAASDTVGTGSAVSVEDDTECLSPSVYVAPESETTTREGQEPSDIEDGHSCSSPCVSPAEQNDAPADVVEPSDTMAQMQDDTLQRMQQELDSLRRENERLRREQEVSPLTASDTDGDRPSCAITDSTEGSVPTVSPSVSPRPRRIRTKPRSEWQQADLFPTDDQADAEPTDSSDTTRKVIAAVATVAVLAVVVHFFGLLGPAFFGLICGGLLKG